MVVVAFLLGFALFLMFAPPGFRDWYNSLPEYIFWPMALTILAVLLYAIYSILS